MFANCCRVADHSSGIGMPGNCQLNILRHRLKFVLHVPMPLLRLTMERLATYASLPFHKISPDGTSFTADNNISTGTASLHDGDSSESPMVT